MWHWQNAMITKDGKRTPHYDMVSHINTQLQQVGDVLLDRQSLAVFHIGTVPDKKVTYWQGSFGDVTSMDAACITAGFFEGDMMLLANKDYELPQSVTFTVAEGKAVQKLNKQSGIWEMLTPTDGTYTLTLAAGDGELLRIV